MVVYGIKIGERTERKIADGIYLHGKLERENGYDMCSLDIPKKEGIYDCAVMIGNDMFTSKLFYWTVSNYGKKINRGLVAWEFDKNGMEEARKMYDERKAII